MMNNISVVCFGEILWDNLPEGRRLGGAPLNVCYHLTKSGIDSSIISQVGNDQNGKDIIGELYKLRISATYCNISDQKPTSTVEVHTVGQQVSYEIVENVAWDFIEWNPGLEQLVKNADALVFGSLATRSEVSRSTLFRLMEVSRFRVFDMNLRSPFYQKEEIYLLLEKANLLKLNEEELGIIMQWLGVNEKNKREQLQFIIQRFPNIREIILTLGADGSVYSSEAAFIEQQAHKVQVKDTVGSGDSFLAAFLSKKLKGRNVEESLQSASLLSGFIATQHGACPVYDEQDLLAFKKSLQLIRN
ncbi:MAG: carbohydrate kinase family protein [Pseudobacter sp.]|uniref:carbohydrate kinase family protein n=1 Tax=Pseudobacter sp. TaxID=2045420 RepID=UPI003F8191E3